MRVFVTGATGFIGRAIVAGLLGAGHEVVGLARSEAAAEALTAAGAGVRRGSLAEPESLRAGAAEADGVIHAAFVHDFSDYAGGGRTDLRAIEAMGEALAGSGRPFVVTSVTPVVTPGRPGTEKDAPDPAATASAPRVASENAALALAQRGVRASAVRLPPSVHGEEDGHGFVPALIRTARATGVSATVGDGSNRWPAVHRLDAARLYVLALESAPAGSVLHAVADEAVPLRAIAGVIGRRLALPLASLRPEEAEAHFSWLAHFAALDNPMSSTLTRQLLDWHPSHPTLLEDLEAGFYFTA